MFTLKKGAVDIAIVCSDFDKSLYFYRDQLGLEVVLDLQIPEALAQGADLAPRGFRQLRVKAGDTLIKLMEIDSPPSERSLEFQAGVRWLTFLVEDVPGAVAKLKEKGVEFVGDPLTAPDAKYVVCAKGPDGILIELVQVE